MHKWYVAPCSVVVIALLSATIALQAARGQSGAATTSAVKVMTYNVNEGSDFAGVFSASNFPEFVQGVQETIAEVTASNPPLRMQAVAHQIAITQPDMVGLQEVTTWLEGPLDSPSVQYDMLQELMDQLAAQGLNYSVVVKVPEFQLAGPLDTSMATWVFVENFDVMLARSDKDDMQIANVQWAHYHTLLPLTTPVGSLTIDRGWGSADVTLHGQTFRFIVTHLENYNAVAPITLLIQEAQAKELTDVPAYVNMPVIIAGDFNADALGKDASIATYQEMLSLGFSDAWGTLHANVPGPTWQLVNSSPVDTAFQRIDYIYFSSSVRPLTCTLAGNDPHDKIGGLWPSDHAGVRATLRIRQP